MTMEGEQRRPPPLLEVLRLVDHHRVEPWTEPFRGLGERLRQRVVEVVLVAAPRRLADGDRRLLRELDAELVEVMHLEVLDPGRLRSEVFAELRVEAGQQ